MTILKVSLIKAEYPLKQGLKHIFNINDIIDVVKVEYPLKQGLNYLLKTTTFI